MLQKKNSRDATRRQSCSFKRPLTHVLKHLAARKRSQLQLAWKKENAKVERVSNLTNQKPGQQHLQLRSRQRTFVGYVLSLEEHQTIK